LGGGTGRILRGGVFGEGVGAMTAGAQNHSGYSLKKPVGAAEHGTPAEGGGMGIAEPSRSAPPPPGGERGGEHLARRRD